MIQNVFVMQIAYFTCSGEDFQSQRFRKYLVIAEVKLGKAVSFKSVCNAFFDSLLLFVQEYRSILQLQKG